MKVHFNVLARVVSPEYLRVMLYHLSNVSDTYTLSDVSHSQCIVSHQSPPKDDAVLAPVCVVFPVYQRQVTGNRWSAAIVLDALRAFGGSSSEEQAIVLADLVEGLRNVPDYRRGEDGKWVPYPGCGS